MRRTPMASVLAQVPSAYEVSMQQLAVSVEQALADKNNKKDTNSTASGKNKKKEKATTTTAALLQEHAMTVEQTLAEKGKKDNTTDTATKGKKKKNATDMDSTTEGKKKKKEDNATTTAAPSATSLLERFTKSPTSTFETFSLLEEDEKIALINQVLEANSQQLWDAWEDMPSSDKQRVALAMRRTPMASVLAQVPSAYEVSMQQRAVS